jgi:hypothetical protein
MRARRIDGIWIITDVYQPPELERERRWMKPVFITLCLIAVSVGALLGLAWTV